MANRLLKISQLLRRYKKFKLLRMSKYAATLNFFCFLHLEFLNSLLGKDFFNRLLTYIQDLYVDLATEAQKFLSEIDTLGRQLNLFIQAVEARSK